jgi:hypothetical protein
VAGEVSFCVAGEVSCGVAGEASFGVAGEVSQTCCALLVRRVLPTS